MLLDEVARTSEAVAATTSRTAKVAALADCLRRLGRDEAPIAVAYLSGTLPHGPIGVGWAAMRELPPPAATPAELQLGEVDAALRAIGAASGPGSQAIRRRALAELFGHATDREQRFLRALLHGELRQGALESVVADGVALAADVPARDVRRALMLAGDLGAVAAAALAEGSGGLATFRLEVLRPLQPMLARTAESTADAIERVGEAVVEWKLDGARLQVHRRGDEVRAFTRNLADITDRVPEVVEAVLALPVDAVVLDGEAIALRADGGPEPFQVTMSRFGSRTGRAEVALSPFFFDCLHLDGDDLLDLPLSERRGALTSRVPESMRPAAVETRAVEEADRLLAAALARGHEGVMVKALTAPYEAGRRGAGWLKVKPVHTLDLVILAAEWGHGRRQGRLSNLHLGARDEESGGFVMLGKTFKGLTDTMLEWQTEQLLERETGRDGHVVHVRPELVVEIAFDGVQASTRYPGGVALRFARVKGYRPDKPASEADTIARVRTYRPRAAADG